MASQRIPPGGSPHHPGSTLPIYLPIDQQVPDHQIRRRAASCSTLSDGAAGSRVRRTPPARVYIPTSPSPLTHMLVHSTTPSTATLDSFEQAVSTGHRINTETLSIGSGGITRDQTTEFSSPTSLNPGAMWPGTAVGYPRGGICQGYQGFQDPLTSLALPNDPSCAPITQSGYSPMGLMLTVTQPPCDGPTSGDQTLSEDHDSRSGILQSLAPSGQFTSPSAAYWLGDQNLLYAPGSQTPSSRSTLSSPSASPFSKFSQLSLNSPSSSIGCMDDDGPLGGYLQPECQTREPQGGVNGWGSEQGSISITSPPYYDNIPGLLAGNPFLPVEPPISTSTITDACALPNDIGAAGSPEPCRQPQSFHVEGSYPLTGERSGVAGKLATNSQPSPSDQFLPPPSSSEDQRSAVFGFASHFYSGPSAMPFAYDASTLPAIDASGICSPAAVEAAGRGVCLSRHLRIGGPRKKTGGWSDEASRAKKVAKEYRNQLLHISIEVLEQNGRIPRMPSLRDTMRAIILNCFGGSPTRQNIVDLLFDALPERTRMEVVEVEIKKYLKDRIGHILSAPGNKNMFVNISGRWTIREGFE